LVVSNDLCDGDPQGILTTPTTGVEALETCTCIPSFREKLNAWWTRPDVNGLNRAFGFREEKSGFRRYGANREDFA